MYIPSRGRARLSRFSSQTVDKCPFHGPLGAMFSALLCFLLVISLFKVAPRVVLKCLLSRAPELRKAVMCSWRKHTCQRSFVHVGVLGEFSVNEPTIRYIVEKEGEIC